MQIKGLLEFAPTTALVRQRELERELELTEDVQTEDIEM